MESTPGQVKSAFAAACIMAWPSSSLRNSPLELRSFRAFHSLGLCEAVRMIPPSALLKMTAISVVGVEAIPASITSTPQAIRVPVTRDSTISPEMRASRPTTILGLRPLTVAAVCRAYAVVNLTISMGVRASPARPPTVPLIPEIETIRDIFV